MEVTDAIEQAKSDLAGTVDELRMAKELVLALEADQKRIQLELMGLESYAKRRGLTSVSYEPNADVVPISSDIQMLTENDGPDIAMMSRTDAVITVMRSAPGPMDRSAIHEQFVDGGRYDTIDNISLTLSGLKRAQRAQKLGRGLWQLSEEAAEPEAFGLNRQ